MNIFKRSKITEIEENIKILDFLIRNKTKKTYAFDIDDISKGTGIKNLSHDRFLKIKNIEWVECYGKIFYTYMGTEERFQRAIDELVIEGKVKEENKNGVRLYSYSEK